MKRITVIPFDGFYESHITHHLHSEADPDDIGIDYSIKHEGAAKVYVDLFEKYMGKVLDQPIRLDFKELTSPRFYNFETDRIFCEMSTEDIEKLFKTFKESEDAQERIDARFKSRPGFMSFYSEFVNEWAEKPLSEWDYNELSALFPEPDWIELYEDCNYNGELSDCITYTEDNEDI